MEAIKNGGQEVVKQIVDLKFDAMVLVKIKTSQNHFEQNGLKCCSIYDVKLPRNRQKTVEPEKQQLMKVSIETGSSQVVAAADAAPAENVLSVQVNVIDPSATTLVESSSCGSIPEFGSPSLVVDEEKNVMKSLNNSTSKD